MSTGDDRLVKLVGARARARQREAEAEALARVSATDVDSTVERTLAALHAQRAASSAGRPRSRRARFGIRRVHGLVAIVPLAAALALAVGLPLTTRSGAPAGEYAFEVRGHVESERAAADGTFAALEARDGSFQSVIVRPRTATRTKLEARVLVVRGAVGTALEVTPEASDLGTFRIDLPGDALHGASEVRVVIAPHRKLDAAVAAAVRDPSPALDEAVVVRVPVEAPPAALPEKK
jgi:hypothetical protein